MKKFISIVLSMLFFMPIVKPLVDDNLDNNIYNYMVDDETIIGKDNLGENSDGKFLPQMSNVLRSK